MGAKTRGEDEESPGRERPTEDHHCLRVLRVPARGRRDAEAQMRKGEVVMKKHGIPEGCEKLPYSGTSCEWVYYRDSEGVIQKRYEHARYGRDRHGNAHTRYTYGDPVAVVGEDLEGALAAIA